jgi:hypothetical protein
MSSSWGIILRGIREFCWRTCSYRAAFYRSRTENAEDVRQIVAYHSYICAVACNYHIITVAFPMKARCMHWQWCSLEAWIILQNGRSVFIACDQGVKRQLWASYITCNTQASVFRAWRLLASQRTWMSGLVMVSTIRAVGIPLCPNNILQDTHRTSTWKTCINYWCR